MVGEARQRRDVIFDDEDKGGRLISSLPDRPRSGGE